MSSRLPLPPNVERSAFELEAAELLSDLAMDSRVRIELERVLGDSHVRSVASVLLPLAPL